MKPISEEVYNNAVKAVAEIVVAHVSEDYEDIESQRGEYGNYLGYMIKDIHSEVEKLLDR